MRIAPVFIIVALASSASAAPSIEIDQAMTIGAKQHPQASIDVANLRAADARVDIARARWLPDLELFAQLDRSTSNTNVGVMFPEPGIPVVSGAAGRTFGSGAFGSAVGATVSWDLLGFERWDAETDAANADARHVQALGSVSELDRGFLIGDRFISVVVGTEKITAAQAGVDRAHVFVTIVKAAVDQNLRPGADLSRADAELSLAQTLLIRAEADAEVSLGQYAEAFGSKGAAPVPAAGRLLESAPHVDFQHQPTVDIRKVAVTTEIDAARSRESAIETGDLPRVNAVGAVWVRGGDDPGGIGADGLVPDVPNWVAGLVVTWPLLSGMTLAPQARVEEANVARGQARLEELIQHDQSLLVQAGALLDAAYRISDTTPLTLKAARDAEQQSVARYQAKLATADDVAQTQRLLAQAEIDDVVARLEVWRSILRYAYSRGDLELFLTPYHETR
jgi:outer membrane protein